MDLGAFLRARRFEQSPVAIRAYGALRSIASRLGFQVVLKTFYSPIPDLGTLPADTFADWLAARREPDEVRASGLIVPGP